MNNQDLSGKIVFKVRLDKEIKKLIIHNDDINFNELLLMMQRIFSDKIKPHDEISIKYTDEENDLITLSNDSDVLLALQNSKILKLTIFLNDKEEDVEELKPADIVKELSNIRSSIDRFLDKFDALLQSDKYKPRLEEIAKTIPIPISNGNISSILNAHKEFDPLAKKNEVVENKPPARSRRDSRAHTPDSVGSLELSPHPKKYEQFPNAQNVPQLYGNLNLNPLNGNAEKANHQMQMPQNNGVHDNPYFNQNQQPPQPPQPQQSQQFQSFVQPQQQQVPPPIQQQQQQPQHHQQPTHSIQQPPNQFYPNQPVKQNQPQNQGIPFQNSPQMPNPMDPMVQQQMFQHPPQVTQPQVPQQQQQQAPPPNWHMQQQQPQQQPQMLASQSQQMLSQAPQQQQQPPMLNQPNGGFMPQAPVNASNNPYAKPPPAGVVHHRPSSTTIYQQGYK